MPLKLVCAVNANFPRLVSRHWHLRRRVDTDSLCCSADHVEPVRWPAVPVVTPAAGLRRASTRGCACRRRHLARGTGSRPQSRPTAVVPAVPATAAPACRTSAAVHRRRSATATGLRPHCCARADGKCRGDGECKKAFHLRSPQTMYGLRLQRMAYSVRSIMHVRMPWSLAIRCDILSSRRAWTASGKMSRLWSR